jgi:cytochrome c
MFDTMTMTKIVGGLCGTFLVFLMANWAAETLYHVGPAGHGEGAHLQAYTIPTEGGEAPEAETAGPVEIAPLLASADAAAGEKVFNKCKSCHKLDGNNGTGPHLDGVIGRDIASAGGFTYTAALTDLPGNWEPQQFSDFMANPKSYAPGTKMAIALPKPEDRANLIAFLETKAP